MIISQIIFFQKIFFPDFFSRKPHYHQKKKPQSGQAFWFDEVTAAERIKRNTRFRRESGIHIICTKEKNQGTQTMSSSSASTTSPLIFCRVHRFILVGSHISIFPTHCITIPRVTWTMLPNKPYKCSHHFLVVIIIFEKKTAYVSTLIRIIWRRLYVYSFRKGYGTDIQRETFTLWLFIGMKEPTILFFFPPVLLVRFAWLPLGFFWLKSAKMNKKAGSLLFLAGSFFIFLFRHLHRHCCHLLPSTPPIIYVAINIEREH